MFFVSNKNSSLSCWNHTQENVSRVSHHEGPCKQLIYVYLTLYINKQYFLFNAVLYTTNNKHFNTLKC